MTNEEKATEIAIETSQLNYDYDVEFERSYDASLRMAEWKDEQMKAFYRNELLKLNTYICKLFQVDDFIDVEQSVKELEKLNS